MFELLKMIRKHASLIFKQIEKKLAKIGQLFHKFSKLNKVNQTEMVADIIIKLFFFMPRPSRVVLRILLAMRYRQ
jgi:ribosome biogenesis protein Nip4